jgi:two-component system nitrate/nitrite response regulator NarL
VALMNEILLIVRAQILREGLRKLLSEAAFAVIGEASTPNDALKLVGLHRDRGLSLIVLEAPICYETPGFLDAARRAAPKARIVILAANEDVPRLGHRHIAAVDGVLSLAISAEVMAQSLRLIQLGERIVPTEFIAFLMSQNCLGESKSSEVMPVDTGTSEPPVILEGSNKKLTSTRETEILGHLINGCSNKIIARHLGITEATVKVHLKGILRKIRACNRTQAAMWALNNGIRAPDFEPPNTVSGVVKLNQMMTSSD